MPLRFSLSLFVLLLLLLFSSLPLSSPFVSSSSSISERPDVSGTAGPLQVDDDDDHFSPTCVTTTCTPRFLSSPTVYDTHTHIHNGAIIYQGPAEGSGRRTGNTRRPYATHGYHYPQSRWHDVSSSPLPSRRRRSRGSLRHSSAPCSAATLHDPRQDLKLTRYFFSATDAVRVPLPLKLASRASTVSATCL